VGRGEEPEQQLRCRVIERGEPAFVDEDEIVAEQVLDHLAGNSRFAEIRPAVACSRPRRRHSYGPAQHVPASRCLAITRFTVLCVVPQATAAPRWVPTSR
jgi:hypothetical protein